MMLADYLNDPVFLLLAISGVFLTGISKSGFAGGAGVVAVPLLALHISPSVAVVLVLPLLLLMDAQTIAYHRRRLALKELRVIVPAALVGVVLGSAALGRFSDACLQFLVGVISLSFALLQLRAKPKVAEAPAHRPWFGGSMGLTAGITSSLIHAGGPPLNMYLASRQLPRALWISTAAVFFASINASKVLSYAWVGLWQKDLLILSALLTPAAIVGVLAGHRIQNWISEAQFVRVVMICLAVSGVALIAKAVLV